MEIERLLSEATKRADGKVRSAAMMQDCKGASDAAIFLAAGLAKFASDGDLDASALASEEPLEDRLNRHIHAAWTELNEARTLLTDHHLSLLRGQRP